MDIGSQETYLLNGSSATATITDLGNNIKSVIARGSTSDHVRSIASEVTTFISVDMNYGAQVGEGGITMGGGSKIYGSGPDGNVVSSGAVFGAGGAEVVGDLTVSSGISEDSTAQSIVCNTDQIVGQSNPQIDHAQSFISSTSSPLAKVSLYIKRNNNVADANILITSDVAGSPNTIALATEILQRSLVDTNYSWIDIIFSIPPILVEGNTYWIVLDSGQHASKYWIWCKDSADSFAGGSPKYKQDWSTGGAWTNVTGDLTFKTFPGAGISLLNDVIVRGTAKVNTIANSTIDGDAYYQIIFNSTVGSSSFPGSPDPVPIAMPITNAAISVWKDQASDGGIISGDCPGTPGCSLIIGPKKIDGNLTVAVNDTLTVAGVLYVTGNLVFGNNTTIRCDVLFVDKSCVIVTDGYLDAQNNSTYAGSGDPKSFIMILSTLKGCLGGTQVPPCGPNNSAINLNNNAQGAIFYTTDSLAYLKNNADLTSVVGYKLHLENNAEIFYNVNVQDLEFQASTSSTQKWTVGKWKEVE